MFGFLHIWLRKVKTEDKSSGAAAAFRKSKEKLFLLLIFFLPAFSLPAFAQSNQTDPIVEALKTGDAGTISRYFGPSVDITVSNTTSTYSQAQGTWVLKDFFKKNPIKGFELQHSGSSSARSSTFTMGYLNTTQGLFKVYMWLKPRDGSVVIKELRFERLGS